MPPGVKVAGGGSGEVGKGGGGREGDEDGDKDGVMRIIATS